ncbi:MAG: metallophosphoesterase [Thermoplasmata archaeon]|nr:metallophosphoesterase [Thermoplasmata archaeon]
MDRVEVSPGVLLYNTGAVLVNGLVAMADLHIGYEAALGEEGTFIPRVQMEEILRAVDRTMSALSPDVILVNGDFKHAFDRNLGQEWEEVEEVLDALLSWAEVVVVRGNHDNFLSTILRRKGVPLVSSHTHDGVLFLHGHKWEGAVEMVGGEDMERMLVLGHEHPAVALRDASGAVVKTRCFLHLPMREGGILVLPAFSPLARGNDVLKGDFLSPLLSGVDMDLAVVYAVTEIGLLRFGTVGEVREAQQEV